MTAGAAWVIAGLLGCAAEMAAPGVFLLGGAGIAWRILRQRRALLVDDNTEVGEEPGRS